MSTRVLVIDDEPDIRQLMAISLERLGMHTRAAGNLAEAKNLLALYEFDVCLLDMRLPDGNGVDFVRYLQTNRPKLPVAVMTAHGNIHSAVEAMKNGAFDFVTKPIDIKLLRQMVTQASSPGLPEQAPVIGGDSLPHKHDKESAISSLATLSGRSGTSEFNDAHIGADVLIGQSKPMQELRTMIGKVAKTHAPVWITGESGTGKELIARLIHNYSARADKPFIAINCDAIAFEWMESELFGHCKGSFSGAHCDHAGVFKMAEGGTLFLDEVAALPLHMQLKLLRVIQERKIRRIGDSQEQTIDVRILSASNVNLASAVEAGTFRHELYYRLNVICIKSPNLRERPSDIPIIAKHILQSINAKAPDNRLPSLSKEALDQLKQYPFPGNVRELENIIERAITLSESNTIELCNLNLPNKAATGSAGTDPITNEQHTDEVQAIRQALAKHRWNRKAAAVELGLSYRQLRYRLQQYGIDKTPTGR